jgi:hypothetical protein
MKKSPVSSRGKKKKQLMPSAFELAALASSNRGDLHRAFKSYLSASEYLETNGPAELDLRKGGLAEKIEAFAKLKSAGVFGGGDAAAEYQKLVAGLRGYRKLYKDKRDDGVKSAAKTVTGRPCNYQTARDHLKKAWLMDPSRYTPPDDKTSAKKITVTNQWDRWCHQHTITGHDKEKGTYRYLLIPEELLEAALRLICRSRKVPTEAVESALRSAAAVEHAIEQPPPSEEEEERQKQWVDDFDAAASVGRSDDLVQLRDNGKWPKERDIAWLKKARSKRISALAGK